MKSFRDSQRQSSELWDGEFWEGLYSARILGDKVTMQMIKKIHWLLKGGGEKSLSANEIA